MIKPGLKKLKILYTRAIKSGFTVMLESLRSIMLFKR
jgi:hypothetical protein